MAKSSFTLTCYGCNFPVELVLILLRLNWSWVHLAFDVKHFTVKPGEACPQEYINEMIIWLLNPLIPFNNAGIMHLFVKCSDRNSISACLLPQRLYRCHFRSVSAQFVNFGWKLSSNTKTHISYWVRNTKIDKQLKLWSQRFILYRRHVLLAQLMCAMTCLPMWAWKIKCHKK